MKTYDLVVDIGLIFLIIFTPLAFGTVQVWSVTIMALLALAVFNIWLIRNWKIYCFDNNSGSPVDKLLRIPLSKPIFFFLALVIFQMLPLPKNVLNLISPNTYNLYANFLPGYEPAVYTGQSLTQTSPDIWRSISVYSYATRYELIKLLSYAMVFFVVAGRFMYPTSKDFKRHHRGYHNILLLGMLTSILTIVFHSSCDFNLHIPANALLFVIILAFVVSMTAKGDHTRDWRFLGKIINSIIIFAFLFSIFAIIQKFTWNGKIYWLRTLTQGGAPFASYVNRNHFAGYMGLCIPLAVANFVAQIAGSGLSQLEGFKSKLLWFSSKHANRAILYLFASLVMTTALLLSLSRGGILSFIIAIAFFWFILLLKSRGYQRKRIVIFIFLVTFLIISMLIWVGPQPVIDRMLTLRRAIFEPIDVRTHMWKDSLKMITDFPIFGTGLGTFVHIYPKYQTLTTMKIVRYPENDYIQLITEMGVFGWVLILLFFFFFLKKVRYCMRRL